MILNSNVHFGIIFPRPPTRREIDQSMGGGSFMNAKPELSHVSLKGLFCGSTRLNWTLGCCGFQEDDKLSTLHCCIQVLFCCPILGFRLMTTRFPIPKFHWIQQTPEREFGSSGQCRVGLGPRNPGYMLRDKMRTSQGLRV